MNANHQSSPPPLSVAELAARWGVTAETVLDRLRTRDIPFVWLGSGEPSLSARGRKLIRFRVESVEQWERNHEWVASQLAPPEPAVAPGAGRFINRGRFANVPIWDGKVR